jgi:hypothetical protein
LVTYILGKQNKVTCCRAAPGIKQLREAHTTFAANSVAGLKLLYGIQTIKLIAHQPIPMASWVSVLLTVMLYSELKRER